jgi:superfamily II DNA or RNA helicase
LVYQVLVFCTTAMVTRLVAGLLGKLNLNVREIHSRKPQSYRTRVSDEFRRSKRLILVTSDVSARGVDYPDVSLVVQVIYVELLSLLLYHQRACAHRIIDHVDLCSVHCMFERNLIRPFTKKASLLAMI